MLLNKKIKLFAMLTLLSCTSTVLFAQVISKPRSVFGASKQPTLKKPSHGLYQNGNVDLSAALCASANVFFDKSLRGYEYDCSDSSKGIADLAVSAVVRACTECHGRFVAALLQYYVLSCSGAEPSVLIRQGAEAAAQDQSCSVMELNDALEQLHEDSRRAAEQLLGHP